MVIYKIIPLYVFCFLFHSCSVNRNEKGKIRIKESNFVNCNINEIYNVIDTTSLYHNIKIDDKTKVFVGAKDSVKVSELYNYLKFYCNGKVAMFQGLDKINHISINPKNAIMGYYCLKLNNNKLKFVFYHVQSGVFISNQSFEVKGDTIIAYTKKDALGGGNYYTYVRTKIDDSLLIHKPDW